MLFDGVEIVATICLSKGAASAHLSIYLFGDKGICHRFSKIGVISARDPIRYDPPTLTWPVPIAEPFPSLDSGPKRIILDRLENISGGKVLDNALMSRGSTQGVCTSNRVILREGFDVHPAFL